MPHGWEPDTEQQSSAVQEVKKKVRRSRLCVKQLVQLLNAQGTEVGGLLAAAGCSMCSPARVCDSVSVEWNMQAVVATECTGVGNSLWTITHSRLMVDACLSHSTGLRIYAGCLCTCRMVLPGSARSAATTSPRGHITAGCVTDVCCAWTTTVSTRPDPCCSAD